MLEAILREIKGLEYPKEDTCTGIGLAAASGFETAKEQAIAIIRQHMEDDGWIPCEEGMPEMGRPVLICDKKGNVCVRTVTSEKSVRTIAGETVMEKGWSKCKYGVVAWKPLPAPYRPRQKAVGEDYKQRVMERFMKVE